MSRADNRIYSRLTIVCQQRIDWLIPKIKMKTIRCLHMLKGVEEADLDILWVARPEALTPTQTHTYVPVMLCPRGQSGLEAKILASASASKFWPRPRGFGLGLASISLSYNVIGHFSCKNCVNSGILLIFPAIILNCMLLIIIWYFFIIIFGLGLDLIVLASAS